MFCPCPIIEKNQSDITTLINGNANSDSEAAKEDNYSEPGSTDSEKANFSGEPKKKSKK